MRKIINTDQAPQAIGAYSQAVEVNNLVFLSGQIPLDPVTMQVVSGGFCEQAMQTFKNLLAVAEAAGGAPKNFIKLNIYLTDLANFALLNDVMQQFFNSPYPARAAVEVSALPKGVLLEIEGIVALD